MFLQKSLSLRVAERLAEFFLSLPIVSAVYLYGSVSMFGDGNDVDLVVELRESNFAFAFLQRLDAEFRKIQEDTPLSEYEALKTFRNNLVMDILGFDGDAQIAFKMLQWDKPKRFRDWLELCTIRTMETLAERTEQSFFRQVDVFLMPKNWQWDERVKDLLPIWPTDRLWKYWHFHSVIVWQARKYDAVNSGFKGMRQTWWWGPHMLHLLELYRKVKECLSDFLDNSVMKLLTLLGLEELSLSELEEDVDDETGIEEGRLRINFPEPNVSAYLVPMDLSLVPMSVWLGNTEPVELGYCPRHRYQWNRNSSVVNCPASVGVGSEKIICNYPLIWYSLLPQMRSEPSHV